ncbi:LuxR C-terminal-related transcriptional regulator [Amycolatopsis sp. NPDC059090]|uniref:helix-turn-helix domain-containing protein n=1 Tax=unclassified Amycolatopsis TaxID=2618356 RepID=UPI00367103DD
MSKNTVLRGRDEVHGRIRELLGRVEDNPGIIISLEGAPGIGKSSVLRKVRQLGTELGFRLAPRELSLFDAARHPGEVRSWCEQQPRAQRILMLADDAQLAAPETIRRLSWLPELLVSRPFCLVLARVPGMGGTELNRLLTTTSTQLYSIRLGPLDSTASSEMLVDLLGAKPDDALRWVAEELGGNPRLLVDLVTGLQAENGIETADGIARLRGPMPPGRLQTTFVHKVRSLTPPTRKLVQVGASLGHTFLLADAAKLLRETPGNLLLCVDEALAAGLLVESGDRLGFPGRLVWQGVADSVPPSAFAPLRAEAEALRDAPAAASDTPAEDDPSARWTLLTSTERHIAELVGSGLTNRQVARDAMISAHTVNYHLRSIYRKLAIRSRVDLTRLIHQSPQ